MNSEICFDACRNIYGKSSSTFWGIFIKIPKLIPRVATLMYTFLPTAWNSTLGKLKNSRVFPENQTLPYLSSQREPSHELQGSFLAMSPALQGRLAKLYSAQAPLLPPHHPAYTGEKVAPHWAWTRQTT